MNESVALFLSWLFGWFLGAIFFGGLWWTVKKGLTAKQPAPLFLGSLAVRMSLTLGGFYLVTGGRWERALACLAGFILARVIITWLAARTARPAKEATHSP